MGSCWDDYYDDKDNDPVSTYHPIPRRKETNESKETIELNGKKYLKSELEEALKHIKPMED